jgi:hypothetical protein
VNHGGQTVLANAHSQSAHLPDAHAQQFGRRPSIEHACLQAGQNLNLALLFGVKVIVLIPQVCGHFP